MCIDKMQISFFNTFLDWNFESKYKVNMISKWVRNSWYISVFELRTKYRTWVIIQIHQLKVSWIEIVYEISAQIGCFLAALFLAALFAHSMYPEKVKVHETASN